MQQVSAEEAARQRGWIAVNEGDASIEQGVDDAATGRLQLQCAGSVAQMHCSHAGRSIFAI